MFLKYRVLHNFRNFSWIFCMELVKILFYDNVKKKFLFFFFFFSLSRYLRKLCIAKLSWLFCLAPPISLQTICKYLVAWCKRHYMFFFLNFSNSLGSFFMQLLWLIKKQQACIKRFNALQPTVEDYCGYCFIVFSKSINIEVTFKKNIYHWKLHQLWPLFFKMITNNC